MTRYHRTPITDLNNRDIFTGKIVKNELSDKTLEHFENSKIAYEEKVNTYGSNRVPEALGGIKTI